MITIMFYKITNITHTINPTSPHYFKTLNIKLRDRQLFIEIDLEPNKYYILQSPTLPSDLMKYRLMGLIMVETSNEKFPEIIEQKDIIENNINKDEPKVTTKRSRKENKD